MSDIQIEYVTAGPPGQSGGGTADDAHVVSAALSNQRAHDVEVTVGFSLSDGQTHGITQSVGSFSTQAFTWEVGHLGAGTYNVRVDVGADLDGTSQNVGHEEASFSVESAYTAPEPAPEPAAPPHNPDDYRLDISTITMQTEGGGVVHEEDEAFATEKVIFYAEVMNNTVHYLGPIEVQFLVDGQDVAWGGMSGLGVDAGSSIWANGSTDILTVGPHTLEIKINSGDPELFSSSSQTVTLNVLEPRNDRAFDEGAETSYPGWIQREVYMMLKDYTGAGIDGDAYIEFSGPGGDTAERAQVSGGRLTLDAAYLPEHGGSVGLTVTTNDGQTLTGGSTITDETGPLSMQWTQAKRRRERSFESSEGLRTMVGGSAEFGVEFKVFSAGGEITTEREWTENFSAGVTYEIWIPQPTLENLADATAEQR